MHITKIVEEICSMLGQHLSGNWAGRSSKSSESNDLIKYLNKNLQNALKSNKNYKLKRILKSNEFKNLRNDIAIARKYAYTALYCIAEELLPYFGKTSNRLSYAIEPSYKCKCGVNYHITYFLNSDPFKEKKPFPDIFPKEMRDAQACKSCGGQAPAYSQVLKIINPYGCQLSFVQARLKTEKKIMAKVLDALFSEQRNISDVIALRLVLENKADLAEDINNCYHFQDILYKSGIGMYVEEEEDDYLDNPKGLIGRLHDAPLTKIEKAYKAGAEKIIFPENKVAGNGMPAPMHIIEHAKQMGIDAIISNKAEQTKFFVKGIEYTETEHLYRSFHCTLEVPVIFTKTKKGEMCKVLRDEASEPAEAETIERHELNKLKCKAEQLMHHISVYLVEFQIRSKRMHDAIESDPLLLTEKRDALKEQKLREGCIQTIGKEQYHHLMHAIEQLGLAEPQIKH